MFDLEPRRRTVPARHVAFRPLLRAVRRFLPFTDRLEDSANGTAEVRRRMLRALVTVWRSELGPHFAACEAHLVPLTRDPETEHRALTEGRRLRAMVAEADRMADHPDPVWLANLARRLRGHLLWQERTWFPEVERTIGVARLRTLADDLGRVASVRRHDDA